MVKRFYEFNIVFVKTQNEVLEGLGIDSELEYFTDKGTIDLNEIEAYWRCERKHEGKETINCQTKSNSLFTLAITYEAFKALLND